MWPGTKLKLTTKDGDDPAVEVQPGHHLVCRPVAKGEQPLARVDHVVEIVSHLFHQIERDFALLLAISPGPGSTHGRLALIAVSPRPRAQHVGFGCNGISCRGREECVLCVSGGWACGSQSIPSYSTVSGRMKCHSPAVSKEALYIGFHHVGNGYQQLQRDSVGAGQREATLVAEPGRPMARHGDFSCDGVAGEGRCPSLLDVKYMLRCLCHW